MFVPYLVVVCVFEGGICFGSFFLSTFLGSSFSGFTVLRSRTLTQFGVAERRFLSAWNGVAAGPRIDGEKMADGVGLCWPFCFCFAVRLAKARYLARGPPQEPSTT